MTTGMLWRYIFLVLTHWLIKGSAGIQNVRLILPPIVRAGTSATLLCLYDLERAPLYSVQWYRGRYEFFRYVPNETPPTKVFHIPGIYVDVFTSNEHQVTLRNIPVHISGEISCEVTADAPSFSTKCDSAMLAVIELEVDLQVSQDYYRPGDTLIANCTASSSIADAKLKFHLDSRRIPDEFISYQSYDFAVLEMNIMPDDLGSSFNGEVQLRCSATLDDTYYVTSRAVTIRIEESALDFLEIPNKSIKTHCCLFCIIIVIWIIVQFL